MGVGEVWVQLRSLVTGDRLSMKRFTLSNDKGSTGEGNWVEQSIYSENGVVRHNTQEEYLSFKALLMVYSVCVLLKRECGRFFTLEQAQTLRAKYISVVPLLPGINFKLHLYSWLLRSSLEIQKK